MRELSLVSEVAMTSNATHGTFEEFIDDVDPELRPICIALRDLVSTVHRDFVEVVWKRQRITSYGVGPKKMSEHYAYIGPQKAHVNLGFYHGASLADPSGLLEGTGKRLRHIKVKSVAEAGLSDDDFSDYWRNIHGPIGAKIPLLNRPKTRITIGQGGIQPGPAISE